MVLFKVKIEVEPFISAIIQCNNCWFYGHRREECKNKTKCLNCSQEHLFDKDFKFCKDENTKCSNCGDGHKANFRKCKKYIEQKEIRLHAAREHITIAQARKVCGPAAVNNYRQERLGQTYAGAVAENPKQGVQIVEVNGNESPNSERKRPDDLEICYKHKDNEVASLREDVNELKDTLKHMMEKFTELLEQNRQYFNHFLDNKVPPMGQDLRMIADSRKRERKE